MAACLSGINKILIDYIASNYKYNREDQILLEGRMDTVHASFIVFLILALISQFMCQLLDKTF